MDKDFKIDKSKIIEVEPEYRVGDVVCKNSSHAKKLLLLGTFAYIFCAIGFFFLLFMFLFFYFNN